MFTKLYVPFFFLLFLIWSVSSIAQINVLVPSQKFFDFYLTSKVSKLDSSTIVIIRNSKNDEQIFSDSILTDTLTCSGFSFPEKQPFSDYFLFSKREQKKGMVYIVNKIGEINKVSGGKYWVAPKKYLLFILAEKENDNLIIYNLKKNKIEVEKFNCDEFSGWFEQGGDYYGKVSSECGKESKVENEMTEWLRPIEIEKYDWSKNLLFEDHLTNKKADFGKELKSYGRCHYKN